MCVNTCIITCIEPSAAGPSLCMCWLGETLWQFAFAQEIFWLAMLLIASAWIAVTAAMFISHRYGPTRVQSAWLRILMSSLTFLLHLYSPFTDIVSHIFHVLAALGTRASVLAFSHINPACTIAHAIIYRHKKVRVFSPTDHLALAMSSINAAWLSVAVSASVLLTAVAYGARAPDTLWVGICLALACTAVALAMLGWKVLLRLHANTHAFS